MPKGKNGWLIAVAIGCVVTLLSHLDLLGVANTPISWSLIAGGITVLVFKGWFVLINWLTKGVNKQLESQRPVMRFINRTLLTVIVGLAAVIMDQMVIHSIIVTVAGITALVIGIPFSIWYYFKHERMK